MLKHDLDSGPIAFMHIFAIECWLAMRDMFFLFLFLGAGSAIGWAAVHWPGRTITVAALFAVVVMIAVAARRAL